jgi:hypothetical protein
LAEKTPSAESTASASRRRRENARFMLPPSPLRRCAAAVYE